MKILRKKTRKQFGWLGAIVCVKILIQFIQEKKLITKKTRLWLLPTEQPEDVNICNFILFPVDVSKYGFSRRRSNLLQSSYQSIEVELHFKEVRLVTVVDILYCSCNLKFNTHCKTDLVTNPHTDYESDLWLPKD